MSYADVVSKAKDRGSKPYGRGKVSYKPCDTFLKGDQINLWTYWQGYQLKGIDKKGVDILLVGQDWGNPDRNPKVIEQIKRIQNGDKEATYLAKVSPTDRNLIEMFKVFGEDIDITKKNPGMRLFFTNYSLGYRKGSETGGMTKSLMREDEDLFNELVTTIKPKIIICLGKITYEMVSGVTAKGFIKRLNDGEPLKAYFKDIPVYGVAHPGARGLSNVGGKENMVKAWKKIARDYQELI